MIETRPSPRCATQLPIDVAPRISLLARPASIHRNRTIAQHHALLAIERSMLRDACDADAFTVVI
jgi:hypothetical protein